MEIKDYPNYQVLEDGTVIGARGRPLKFDTNSVGYRRVTLCKDGITKRVFIHRLVAETFIPNLNPMLYRYVNHKDGDRTNNSVENLEWCTASENVQDGWDRGRQHRNAPVWELILMLKEDGLSTKTIAHALNVHRTTVQRAIRRG